MPISSFMHVCMPSADPGLFFALPVAGRAGEAPLGHCRPRLGLRGPCSRRPNSHKLALVQGIAFRAADSLRAMETSQLNSFALLLMCHICITPLLKLSSPPLCGRRATTTAIENQALPFVPITDGASVWTCLPCLLSSYSGK